MAFSTTLLISLSGISVLLQWKVKQYLKKRTLLFNGLARQIVIPHK